MNPCSKLDAISEFTACSRPDGGAADATTGCDNPTTRPAENSYDLANGGMLAEGTRGSRLLRALAVVGSIAVLAGQRSAQTAFEPVDADGSSTVLTALDQGAVLQSVTNIETWFNRDTPLTASDLNGKLVLLDFWASWCAPCMLSVPHLNDLHSKFGPRGLVICGLSNELVGPVGKVSEKFDYAIAAGAKAASTNFKIDLIPTVIMVRDGQIVYRGTNPDVKKLTNIIEHNLSFLSPNSVVESGFLSASGVTKGATSPVASAELAAIAKRDLGLSTGEFSRENFLKFRDTFEESPFKINAQTFAGLKKFYDDSRFPRFPQNPDAQLRKTVVQMIGRLGRKGSVPHASFELLVSLAEQAQALEPDSTIRRAILAELDGVSFQIEQPARVEVAKRLSKLSDSAPGVRAYLSYLCQVLPQNTHDAEPPASVMLKMRGQERPEITKISEEISAGLNSGATFGASDTLSLLKFGFDERLVDGTGKVVTNVLIHRDRALVMLRSLEVSKFTPAALERAQNVLAKAILYESGLDWAYDSLLAQTLAELGTNHLSGDAALKLLPILKENENNENLTLASRTLRFLLEDQMR